MNVTLIKYVLMAARRDKLMLTLLLMTFICVMSAMFMGNAAAVEQQQFATVFGSGALRFLGVMGVVLFTSFHMRRSFESKEVEFLLSRPISRISFVLSHALAFVILACIIAVCMTVAQSFLGDIDLMNLVSWGYSIALELSIIAVTALFFGMVLNSAAGAALASLGVYVLGRMTGTLLGIVNVPPEGLLDQILSYVMEILSIFLPRLDMMGQSGWLIYGLDADKVIHYTRDAEMYSHKMIDVLGVLGFVSLQSMLFIALILCATLHDFTKKQF